MLYLGLGLWKISIYHSRNSEDFWYIALRLNKLALTRSKLYVCMSVWLSGCLSTVSYPSIANWNSLYHALLNASLCLIQVSPSNSLFSLKPSCFEYFPIFDPILPRSTHDCFAWIDNFNPVSFQNILFYYSSHYFVYLSLRLPTLISFQLPSFQLCQRSSTSYLCRYSSILQ